MAYIGTKPGNQVVDGSQIADGTITPADLSTGKPVWDTNGNVGVGTSSPSARLHISATNDEVSRFSSSGNPFISWFSGATRRGYIQMAGDSTAFYNESAAPMLFGTNGTERMRIDSAGRVTTPFQPAFRATRSSGVASFTGNSTLIYDVALVNIGNCYNASTGVFTAPVAGSYAFSFSYYTDNNTSEMVDLMLNDATIIGRTEIRFNPGDNTVVASGMIIYGLNANDNVRVKNANTGVAQLIGGIPYIYFNGFLIG